MKNLKLVSFGNNKLPKSTMIFNLGAASDCPSRELGLCRVGKACYALQAELMYPHSLPYRRRQGAFWRINPAELIAQYFAFEISRKKKVKITEIRFNEAGDFSDQEDVDKLNKVTEMIWRKSGVRSYVYTARKDLDFSQIGEQLTINGSGFMADNEFRAISPSASTSEYDIICGGDCTKCSLCTKKSGLRIAVIAHGTRKKLLDNLK